MATDTSATSTFSCPHNSTSHDGTLLCHWANSPGARGTLNIFWLCISTLGLCVWNAVHPDVPRPGTSWWRVFGKRLWWLLVGLFMPGMLVLVALGNFRQACQLLVTVDRETQAPRRFPWWMYLFEVWRPMRRNPEDENQWWMGALLWCLRIPPISLHGTSNVNLDLEEREVPQESTHAIEPFRAFRPPSHSGTAAPDRGSDYLNYPTLFNLPRQHNWTLTHSFYALMDGFVDDRGAIDRDHVARRIELPLDDPMRIPDVPLHNIQDRGESSTQAKLLLVWQLFVFLVNCFVRFNQSLPLSLLEIITVSHALSTIIVMMLWWYKPHNVREPTMIFERGLGVPPAPEVTWSNLLSLDFLREVISSDYIFRALAIGDNVDLPQIILLVTAAILYGVPHLLGLSIHFPTFAEQLCWQIGTFTVIGSPLIMCVVVWLLPYTGAAMDMLLQSLVLVLLILYPIASMLLVGESVRQLFALPVESFREPQLTSYLPSFS